MHRNFVIYKPYGMLSQLNTKGYKKKKGLAELFAFPEGVQPVGRLDEDSEGLLLLTSDNAMNIHIRSTDIEKEYWVQLDGEITDAAIAKLEKGVIIKKEKENYLTLPCKVSKIPELMPERDPASRGGRHRPSTWISITIREGKFRQVRKMTAAVGYPTLRLVRVRIGKIRLGSMQPSEVKEVPEFLL